MKFKKWVKYSLLVVNLIMFLIMISEVKDLAIFTVSHIGATLIFSINCMLLAKYTDLFEG